MLSPEFEGSLPEGDAGLRFDGEGFEVRVDTDEDGGDLLGGAAFTKALLENVESLGDGDLMVQTHVITLAPLLPGDFDGGWSGTGKIEIFSQDEMGMRGELVLGFRFQIDELTKDRLALEGWLRSLHVTQILRGKSDQTLMRDATAERGIPLLVAFEVALFL